LQSPLNKKQLFCVINEKSMAGKSKSYFNSFLTVIEKGGNALPHPATLFGIFALMALLLSALASLVNWSAINPITGELIQPVNLLSQDGIHRIILELVNNFTGFAPLGIVLVAMLGIGIAEHSGLIHAVIRILVISAPKRILTFVLVFAGIFSNVASDVGYVLLIPLAGVIFHSVGRHPVAGMAAAFAGVSGGFSANLLLGTIDPLLAGLSQEAAHIVDPDYLVNPTANYYFMVVSTFIIAFTGTFISDKLVEPRLGKYSGANSQNNRLETLNPLEKKALLFSFLGFIVITLIILSGIIPSNGFLRPDDGNFLHSPLIKGVVTWLVIYAGVCGLIYGFITRKYRSDADVMNGMGESIKTLAGYVVLVFFAAQFVAWFKWSNLALILAIKGASLLTSINLGLIPLSILFIIFAATLNMFMGSASAKWAILAPVFIPIFMLMGYSPELSQAVYRIGDSVTNIISPMMSFFALIIAFIQKYDKNAGIGTIIATMIPYSIAFMIAWIALLVGWILLDLPLGPGAGIHYIPGG
jgi:aminobenzoyl-glutamate transport protein